MTPTTTNPKPNIFVQIVTFPFWLVWQLLSIILNLTGRLVAVILGVVLLIVGIIVSLTVIGAIVGVPIGFLGVLLITRGLF
ncbi:MAG TPA: hypothetical protein PK299_11995 [Anaerolineales bacterium]|nr:hypothetical protein [Anaerolineales bacterium]